MLETIPWGAELKTLADAYGDLPCIETAEGRLGFAALIDRATGLAASLRRARLAPGEPVAVSLRNGIPAVVATYGLLLAGAAEVAIEASLSAAEKRRCCALARPRFVIASAAEAPLFAGFGCAAIAADVALEPADIASFPAVPGSAWGRISFTSGTTGEPKAIVHTHAARWLANLLQRAQLPEAPGPGDRVLLMTPFIHGASLLSLAFAWRGATSVLLDGVDTERVGTLLESGDVRYLFAPPTVLAKLAAAFAGRRFAAVRAVFCGTAPLTPALYGKARALFGPVVRVVYGKTEIVNPITILPPGDCDAYYRDAAAAGDGAEGVCVGWPASGVEIELRTADDAPCAAGETGEVHLRARHMYAGHIDAAGFHPLPPGAFHATGDFGRIDRRGRLHLIGRTADVMKSGGYKIHPDEVERAVAEAAGKGTIAITSLPSEYWGEVVVAVAENAAEAWTERARAAAAALARHKRPRLYLAVEELPRNAQGKVMRRRLRDALLQRYRLIDGPHPSLEER